eukprot:TRINITY_DN263_c0_g1_i1.p1 TRINITY_DN263_c0_g1~~TRINITY_DN263_c0_g1_i1.p1  ORF type:complete len:54 (-),score=6.51 TRINITY_DN263_c0_g1_i1:345-506(-)
MVIINLIASCIHLFFQDVIEYDDNFGFLLGIPKILNVNLKMFLAPNFQRSGEF